MIYPVLFILFFIASISCSTIKRPEQSVCGYKSCNAEIPGMINVHLVPHTHDDVGWIVTVDQYYYRQVQFILDGVIAELQADPTKRFIYVEIAFFSRWYNEQGEATKEVVQTLVNQGRLEFILGGWCMNDEAATHYTAIIDQHKLGFEYLRHNFGDCARPKIGWQIDPFGHSREHASLFAQFGFDGLFFGRLDYQDKAKRQNQKTMEFVWKGSPNNIGEQASLFTGVLPNGYNPPNGFCFDISCFNWTPNQQPIMDDPNLHDYNVEQMVDGFINAVNQEAEWYSTNHLIATMGSDFNYVQAHMFFKEMDKLIEYVNARQAVGSNINLLYSTPSCYLKQLNNDNRTWTTKEDDFFPYADNPHAFWTGYFTSRAALKHYVRVVNSYYQSLKQLAALAQLDHTSGSAVHLQHLAEVLGVAQHHDGISGTSKQAVAYDYAQRLADGVNAGQNVINDAFHKLLPKAGTPAPIQGLCTYLNISICNYTETTSSFEVTFYNPLGRPVLFVARLPVAGSDYIVYASDGVTPVPNDIHPISQDTFRIPTPEPRAAKNELVFSVNIPAAGFVTYFGKQLSDGSSLKFKPESPKVSAKAGNTISGKYYSVTFDNNGNLQSITNLTSGLTVPITQNFLYYKGFPGNSTDGQASGAYIFRPDGNTPIQIPLTTWGGIYAGSVVQEAYQQFSSWASQVVRVYADKPYVEVQWTIGPIPIDDNVGKEVVTRYNIPNFGNNGVFNTDANGREILQRQLNYRPTWNLQQTEPVAGNYFPVNAGIGITSGDAKTLFSVLVDRSEGGTSLNDGDVELMLHRRLVKDDGRGVGEALNELGSDGNGLIVRGSHYLLLDSLSSAARVYRTVAQEVLLTPQVIFSNSNTNSAQYVKNFTTVFIGLKTALPANIHLLTLDQFRNNGPVPSPDGTVPYLIRFEHFYEVGEDAILSKPATFDIQNLFSPFNVTDVHELSLGANIPIEQVHRLSWNTEDSNEASSKIKSKKSIVGTVITLGPMEIITLQANINQ
uniref:Alpha-mannosidase n=1 Tax=Arion vulgaris TaxID=1028688 RepID=A0A0B7AW15_9EUPU